MHRNFGYLVQQAAGSAQRGAARRGGAGIAVLVLNRALMRGLLFAVAKVC